MDTPWHIDLFGSLQMWQDEQQPVTRFQTYKTGALLAYLAYDRGQSHAREALADMLWSDAAPESGRNSLRVALNSLRRQLEPTNVPVGAVLMADRVNVRLNPDAYTSDVAQFERALSSERQTTDEAEILSCLSRAVDVYRGPLLTNYYEDWIVPERERLADAYLGALRRLTKALVHAHEFDRALDLARRAVAADTLREGAHRDLMRLYAAIGRPAAALQQFRELERVLRDQLGTEPSPVTVELVQRLTSGMQKLPPSQAAAGGVATARPSSAPAEIPVPVPQPSPRADRIEPRQPSTGGSQVLLQLNRFFGRAEEIAQLQWLLEPGAEGASRLVTLTGPSGAGKTRLAVEVSALLRASYDGRVWFVSLAELSDANLITEAIAGALRLTREPNEDAFDCVVAGLNAGTALLLLDNFEHLSEAGAPLVEALMARAPSLSVLVTSQHRLDIVGERELPVMPLPTPHEESTVEQALECASVRLFVDRAQAARPDFILTERNAAAVSTLCARLEGVPLAIELAAAWAQMLTPPQMLARLSNRFDLLVSPRKRGMARHRTLRSAITWSYRLLSPELQRVFARLSVFRGSWDLDAVREVCEDDDVLDPLWELRQKSLVMVDETDGAMRFRMLESLREFASDLLVGEERDRTGQAHATYYARLADQAKQGVVGQEAAMWLERLEREHANMRSALEWALSRPEQQTALQLASGLWRFWYSKGHVSEGRRWLDRALETAPDAPVPLRVNALEGAGYLADSQGAYDRACALFEEGLRMARESSLTHDTLLVNYSSAAADRGDVETAYDLRKEILASKRVNADCWSIANALDLAAAAAVRVHATERARAYYQESLKIRKHLSDRWGEADALINVAGLSEELGDIEGAGVMREQGLGIFASLDDRWGIAASYINLGYLAAEQGDFAAARALEQDGLSMFREIGDSQAVAFSLRNLAEVARRQGDEASARSLLAECVQVYRAAGNTCCLSHALDAAAAAAARAKDVRTSRLFANESASLARCADAPTITLE